MAEHFTYDDVDIYKEDAALFLPGRWLNTNCVHFGLRLLERQSHYVDGGGKGSLLMFDPSQVSFIRFQLESEDELSDFRVGNDVNSMRWVFIPVNNNASLFETGSHWSFLAYHVPSSTAIHLDSMRGANVEVAREIAKKMNLIVGIEMRKEPKFVSLSPSVCPQQHDGCNCGVYALLFADSVARVVLKGGTAKDDVLITGKEDVWTDLLKGIDGKSPQAYRDAVVETIKELW